MAPNRKPLPPGPRPGAKRRRIPIAKGRRAIARQKPGLNKEGLKKERPVAGGNKKGVGSKDVVKRATPPQRPNTTGKARPIRSFGEATKGSTEVKKAPPKSPGFAQRASKGNKTEVGDKKNIGPKNTQLEARQKLREKREALGKKFAERPDGSKVKKPERPNRIGAAAKPAAKATERSVQKKTQPGTKGSKPRFPFR